MSEQNIIPEAAVEAAAEAVYGMTLDGSIQRDTWLHDFRIALEAAAPHMLAAKVAEAKSSNDHIIEGVDGYSSGFHYALYCIAPTT